MEALIAGVDPAGSLPAQVEAEPVDRLGVAQALEGLEEHHARHHPGRDGGPPPLRVLVQIGEVVVAEEPLTVVGQQAIKRPFLQPIAQDLPRILEAAAG